MSSEIKFCKATTGTLEDKLRSTLAELATRECQLAAGETELARIRQETAQQAELKRKETAQQARAEIRELETQLKMEKTESQRWREQGYKGLYSKWFGMVHQFSHVHFGQSFRNGLADGRTY
ncbi:hypothetical protein X801_08326 [Opisthorchis viverrini]|uniref:Uncharacterized protein n=1 Tax=Opisthorchis viverrini TaxID=6198 RepID=A0A1S8WN00_OPIVI|nr:hypothetical protein X801_08326 [Opisthorchis viverrini]